ncbi:MAG TPA: CesT family type III secretion system chaperone [Polyangiaceae bacterium]|nr:CesT family type III secretion system chaperone [Polyangiaceae bacterium]
MIQAEGDLEGFLTRLERRFERLEDGTYVVSVGPGRPLVALKLAPPVLVVRVEIGNAPADPERSRALFRRLLELNAVELLHAAYGLEGDRIVLGAALELATADPGELEAVLGDVDLALAEQVPVLHELVRHGG